MRVKLFSETEMYNNVAENGNVTRTKGHTCSIFGQVPLMLQVSFPILRQLAEKLLEKSVLIAAKPATKFSFILALSRA